MATTAIGQPLMCELSVPIVGVVAIGTLAGEVAAGWGMAALAVGQALVGELGIPVVGVVAIGTLAGEMSGRAGVAALTIGKAAMVKSGPAPTVGGMAI